MSGIRIRKKILVSEQVAKVCNKCKTSYPEDSSFCPQCGAKLVTKKLQVYANIGKNGMTSISCKTPEGVTINSKGGISFPIAKGMSFSTNPLKKN